MGTKVYGERPYKIQLKNGEKFWIQDFELRYTGTAELDIDEAAERFQQGFARSQSGEVENDGLNRLILAAGLDGVANKRDTGERIDLNMYTDQHKLKNMRKLPTNLLDAIRLLVASEVARSGFGDEFIDSYVKLKNEEWQRFTREISAWERSHTLDC